MVALPCLRAQMNRSAPARSPRIASTSAGASISREKALHLRQLCCSRLGLRQRPFQGFHGPGLARVANERGNQGRSQAD